jgi:uncharacterized membrane protein
LLVQILYNTPSWVFVLFFALLVISLMQTRTRTVRKIPAFLLPAGMIALSLAGINSSFGLRPLALASWSIALGVAAFAGYALFRDRRVEYDARENKFLVPGSWASLAVIMAIFFAKYAYAVMHAFSADVISAPLFVAVLSGVYGLLSGYFAARALNLIKKARMVQQIVRADVASRRGSITR